MKIRLRIGDLFLSTIRQEEIYLKDVCPEIPQKLGGKSSIYQINSWYDDEHISLYFKQCIESSNKSNMVIKI